MMGLLGHKKPMIRQWNTGQPDIENAGPWEKKFRSV